MRNLLKKFINSFTVTEKTFLLLVLITFVISGSIQIYRFSQNFLIETPRRGGVIREGVIGVPRLINPLLATTETDLALTKLVYSGLFRLTSEGLIPEIAIGYEFSEDMTQFTVELRRDVFFHDGQPLNADDVIYTIEMARKPEIGSSERANWEGIQIEKINNYQILFILPQPHPPFLQNLTLGILPKHIWKNFDANEFILSNINLRPIGSGPFKISRTNFDSFGIPVSFHFDSFRDFVLGRPKINRLVFKFAKNQDDLLEMVENGRIDSAYGFSFQNIRNLKNGGANFVDFPLPRLFGIFLNQNENNILVNRHVRQALNIAVPKEEIIEEILFGLATKINSPIPERLITREDGVVLVETMSMSERIEASKDILTSNGWSKNDVGIMTRERNGERQILSLTISTNNTEDLFRVTEMVAKAWEQIGVEINIEIYEQADFRSNVIRPRNFEVLLFGMIINRPSDLFAFWHSSQRLDPGLNLTSYANIDVNKLLDDIRNEAGPDEINSKLLRIEQEIKNDIPAIFIYSPHFAYVVPKNLKNMNIENITSSEERFSEVYKWYLKTGRRWSFK